MADQQPPVRARARGRTAARGQGGPNAQQQRQLQQAQVAQEQAEQAAAGGSGPVPPAVIPTGAAIQSAKRVRPRGRARSAPASRTEAEAIGSLQISEESEDETAQMQGIKQAMQDCHLKSELQPLEKKHMIDVVRNLSKQAPNDDPNTFVKKVATFLHEDIDDALGKATLPSDLYFITNISKEVCSMLQAKLEEDDPCVTEWTRAFPGDGKTIESWCPGGLDKLYEISQNMLMMDYSPFKDDSLLEELVIKEKKQPQHKQLPKSEPTKPTTVEKKSETDTNQEANIKKVLEIFIEYTKGKKWVNYFEFVINPDSFVQSVQNIYLMSFLVAERYIKMAVGNDNALYIAQKTANINDETARHLSLKKSRNHLIISLNFPHWQALVKKLNITKSVLPEFVPKKSDLDDLELEEFGNETVFLKP